MKRNLLFFYFLLILYATGSAQNPAYIIDFENDTPTIDSLNEQLIRVSGEVLLNDETRAEAGFGYSITLSISGGPSWNLWR